MQNPFIQAFQTQSFSTRDEAIPFTDIKTEHFMPALDWALNAARNNILAIKSKAASFENSILGLEIASEYLDAVASTYFSLFSAEANEDLQALAKEISPKLAAYTSDISLDPELFAKVKTVHDSKADLNLDPEQTRLLEKCYTDFVRNGANLSENQKAELRTIDQELSALGPQFSENVLKATNAFELIIENRRDLAGLPDSAIEAAHFAAKEKGHLEKWLFNLQGPSFVPFLQYASNRELRKKMWFAYNSKAFNDKFDNQEIIKKITSLKAKRAQLLGFANHAEFVLAERMAKNSQTVNQFLQKLLAPSRKAAEKDITELRSFKKSLDGSDEVMPWDFAYYSEKLKEKKFSFNEEELRPYFKLESVIEGVFEHARRLYSLTFKEVFDVPKYHADVKTYEVREEGSQKYIGLFYGDFFPRETKKGGAWMTTYRDQGLWLGKIRRPHVSIVCNFTKPTPTKPSLLTYDEVLTLFHEFGHALHGLLSQCQYRSLSGANVYWDFVELPSQIMENWAKEKEGLDLFARHFQTGEPIPADLIEKIKLANRFQSGYYSLRQVSFAMLDMAWYGQSLDFKSLNVDEFEKRAQESTRILPKTLGTNMSCSFSHIFAGGYSAGYYSYKWAEVLDADAFELFKEKGLFNQKVASSFKDNILSKGGTTHPMELYKKFRGREPDSEALLRRDGLLGV